MGAVDMIRALLAPTALLGALFLVVSCQTMTPEACQVADWHALGIVDGEAGANLSKFEARQSDCAKTGVKADFAAYDAGRLSGLRTFCPAVVRVQGGRVRLFLCRRMPS